MTPHEGPSERLPDPVPGCEPTPNRFHPPLPEFEDAPWGSRTVLGGTSSSPTVFPYRDRCSETGLT